jgi:hypothetical protein
MLQRSLELRESIERYALVEPSFLYCPSELEWEAIKALVEVLRIFYDATMKLSGTKYPTLNLYYPEFCEVYLAIKRMQTSLYPFIVEMGKEMFKKWDKYWTQGNTLLAIACVFDPRAKLAVVEYYYKLMHPEGGHVRFLSVVKSCMDALFKEYVEAHSKLEQNQHGSSSSHGRYDIFLNTLLNFFITYMLYFITYMLIHILMLLLSL